LVILSDVESQFVRINGTPVGSTEPPPRQLSAGRHTIQIDQPGYFPYQQTITVIGGEITTLNVTLEMTPAERALRSARTEMVRIPEGEFIYGPCKQRIAGRCEPREWGTSNTKVFWIDKTEVTVAAYRSCVDAGHCSEPLPWVSETQPEFLIEIPEFEEPVGFVESEQFCNWGRPNRDQHPINCVDWHQARDLCEWMGKRLPVEREWEKAARGVDGRRFPWGERNVPAPLNIADETSRQELKPHWKTEPGYEDGFATTAPVGSFPQGASPYGVYDMAGNVTEWVEDQYGTFHFGRSIRGGSWQHLLWEAQSDYRIYNAPLGAFGFLGFRCARDQAE